MGKKSKAPTGCYWRGDVLWGQKMVGGVNVRWSLETDNPAIAKQRRKETLNAAIANELERRGYDTMQAPKVPGQRGFDEALELLPDYFTDRAVGERTQKEYLKGLSMITGHLEGKALNDINGELLSQIVQVRRSEGAKNATIKRNLGALSAVFNAAIAKGWVDVNPVLAMLKNIRERRDPIIMPLRADIDLVMTFCPPTIASMVDVAIRTGLRQDELCKLRRVDIDHNRKQLLVRRHDKGGPKGGKTRYVDLLPFDAYESVRALPVCATSDLLFWHAPVKPRLLKDGSAGHGGLDYKNFASNFCTIVRRAAQHAKAKNIPFRKFRFHDLRHYHAVEFLKAGNDIYDLQKRLGHSSVKVTEMYLEYLTAQEERIAKFGKVAG